MSKLAVSATALFRLRPQLAMRHDNSWDATDRRGHHISWARHFVGAGRYTSDRLIPSFFIRLRRVLGCKLSNLAAPLGPSMTPPACRSIARIWRRSISSSENEATSSAVFRAGVVTPGLL